MCSLLTWTEEMWVILECHRSAWPASPDPQRRQIGKSSPWRASYFDQPLLEICLRITIKKRGGILKKKKRKQKTLLFSSFKVTFWTVHLGVQLVTVFTFPFSYKIEGSTWSTKDWNESSQGNFRLDIFARVVKEKQRKPNLQFAVTEKQSKCDSF